MNKPDKKMADKNEEIKEPKVIKKIIRKEVDVNNGKVQFFTEGYTTGEKIKVTVNNKSKDVEINDNHGVYASGSGFKEYPSIKVNG